MIMETGRLFLQEMRQADYADLYKILQDADVVYDNKGVQ